MAEQQTRTETVPFTVLGDKIAVVPDPEQASVGSIYLPEKARKKASSGVIVGYGLHSPNYAEIGRRVVFNHAAGTTVRIADQVYIILSPEEVLGWLPLGVPLAPAELA